MVQLFEQDIKTNDRQSSKGNQLKWCRNNVWYKADYMGYEGLVEYVVSRLLEKSSLKQEEYVLYKTEEINYKRRKYLGCKSENFLPEGWQLITLERLFYGFYNESLYKKLFTIPEHSERLEFIVDQTERITGISDFGKYMSKILAIDTFFMNEDRHMHNIGVLMDAEEKYHLCPIFDNGAGLLSDIQMDYPMEENINNLMEEARSKTLCEDFDEQIEIAEELYGQQIRLKFNEKDVKEIFTWCRSIKSLELPDSVTEIGEYAFSICYGLEAIHLSKGLTNVVYGTFVDCSKLTDITIPENVTKIDTDAFKGCQALRSVYIPGNSVKIEKRAIGYNSDTEKNSTLLIIGHKGSTAETYAAGESFAFHNVADPLTHYASVEPTCINEGNIEYWHCNVCGKDFSNEAGTVVSGETKIEKLEHKFTWVDWKKATCTEDGNREYWHCESCGKNYDNPYDGNELESVVYPATGHELELVPGLAGNCWSSGRREYYQCRKCGKTFLDKDAKKEISDPNDLIIPSTGHVWSGWKLIQMSGSGQAFQKGKSSPINLTNEYVKQRDCEICGTTLEVQSFIIHNPCQH